MWAYHHWPVVHSAIIDQARHGLKAWRAAMKQAVDTGKLRPIGKWIKGVTELPILETEDGLQTDPDVVGKLVRDAWAAVYCPEDFACMDDGHVERIAQAMKKKPWTVPAITRDMLCSELARKGDSAAGPDNITMVMLKALPPNGLQTLAAAMCKIETENVWPEELTSIAAVAIPRPDKRACVGPLKYRIISIASQVYRLWAAAKAHLIHQHWLPCVVPAAVHGGIPHRSARTATHLEALAWETAAANEQPLWALYADASRCFDCLRYQDLLGLAEALGLDEALIKSMKAWYLNQKRVIQIDSVQQKPIRQLRGLPQGCPLSVALCAMWGAVWATGAEAMLSSELPSDATRRATVYLDDISVLASKLPVFLQIAGFTSLFFKDWGITMNADKTVVVANPHAKANGDIALPFRQDDDAALLGTMTGPFPVNTVLSNQCEKALVHLRRLQHLPLGQLVLTKIIQIYVVPLLYGSEMVEIPVQMTTVDKMIRAAVWGRARCAANWSAVRALCMAGHRTDCRLARECESFKCMWSLATEEESRKDLLRIWNRDSVPRQSGLWHEFLLIVASYGGRLVQGGGLCFEDWGIDIHINMPLRVFRHQVRVLQRCWLLGQAQKAVPGTYDMTIKAIDWDATRRKVPCHPAVGTVLCNGVNTLKRAYHHFHSVPSPCCEYDCGVEDDVAHRLLDCQGVNDLRRSCGITADDLHGVRARCRATAECAIWEFEADTLGHRLDIRAGEALWPSERWMRALIDFQVEVEVVQLQFHYLKQQGERHPELRRHAAQITSDDQVPLPGQAISRCDVYTRRLWELDTLILAAMIAILKPVRVEIGGLACEWEQLWQDLLLHKSSNAYLARMCQAVRGRLRAVDNVDHDDVVVWTHLLPPQAVVDRWNQQFVVAGKLQKFYEGFLDCYPTAHRASRQHGLRGGFEQRDNDEHYCVIDHRSHFSRYPDMIKYDLHPDGLVVFEVHPTVHRATRQHGLQGRFDKSGNWKHYCVFEHESHFGEHLDTFKYDLCSDDKAVLGAFDSDGFQTRYDFHLSVNHYVYVKMIEALAVALLLREFDSMLNVMTVRSQGLHFFSRLSSSLLCLEWGVILMTIP